MSKIKLISLWAGPGAGKSTTAAALFAHMKRLRYSVELVTEYAKDLTYEQHWSRLADQLVVLAEQNFRVARCQGQAEYVVTDSPIPLGLVYAKPEHKEWLRPIVHTLWDQYENYPFILRRTNRVYVTEGRNQTEAEARSLDLAVYALAGEFGAVPEDSVCPDDDRVVDQILNRINFKQQPVYER